MKAIAEMGYSRGMEWPLSLQILEEELPALMLSKEESRDMVDALKEDMTPGKAKVILLRFNEHILRIHDKSYMAYVEDGGLQVEHVLPQTLPSTGAWGQFSEEDHAYWVKKYVCWLLRKQHCSGQIFVYKKCPHLQGGLLTCRRICSFVPVQVGKFDVIIWQKKRTRGQ
jgi:hypothetical protein